MASELVVYSRLTAWLAPAREADWEALYAAQLPRVYNFFRFRVGDGPVAEDLTAITFEKAWRARHRYRRDLAAFSTWLLAIARNVAADHFRRHREHLPLAAAEHVAAGDTPAELAERRSDEERERELVALKYGAGLTNRAIARQTGLSETNVGTLLHRTVRTLRARWDEGGL